jgi:hypothetical protein
MVELGSARIVMGNHEFNAISYATPNPETPGEFMRPHSDKNRRQHKAFVDQVQCRAGLYAESIEWLKTMPLYLDLDGLRVVHACWSDVAIRAVEDRTEPGSPMSSEFVQRANQKGSPEYQAIEVLLKGPELSLTKYGQVGFKDKDGTIRHEARIRWWDSAAKTLDELAEIPPNSETVDGTPFSPLPDQECMDESQYSYLSSTPVLYGHYWRRWEPKERRDWTRTTACVDFSAVKGGPLVAYQWDGEPRISPCKFVEYPVQRRIS